MHNVQANDQLFIDGWVNLRRTPGYVDQASDDVIGQLAHGTAATVLAGPQQADGLAWWQVRSTLDDSPAEGWVAATDPQGKALLGQSPPPDPPPTAPPSRVGSLAAGEPVANVSGGPVNLRASAGYVGKPAEDVVAEVPAAAALTVEDGPQEADDLVWWRVACHLNGQAAAGWVAEAAPNGLRLLAPAATAQHAQLHKPFAGTWAVTQWWGSNPDFYRQFNYDGVPLRGHNGLDFATPLNTSILAVDAGEVLRADFEPGGFGYFILLRHAWGESIYAHLERIQVRAQQAVGRGQAIGLSGNTGASTGPHLHFSIRLFPYRRTDGWGGFTDPQPFMNPQDLARSRAGESAPTPMAEEVAGRPRP